VRRHATFSTCIYAASLSQKIVQTKKTLGSSIGVQGYGIGIVSASMTDNIITKRAFSTMKIIKSKSYNKIANDLSETIQFT